MTLMKGYITIGTNNLTRSAAFYEALFEELGFTRQREYPGRAVYFGTEDDIQLVVITPADGQPATTGNGTMIALNVDVQHDCLQSGVLWGGSFDARTGSVLEGEILDPSLEVVLDSNRMARVQFTPLSPWGADDFDWQVLQIVGPMDWDEMIHENGDEDQRVDHFEIPHSVMIGDANRTVRVWSSEKPLEPGKYMIDGCFVLTDQNPGDTCHVVGVLRFEVPEDKDPLLGGFWAAILVPLSIIGCWCIEF